MESSVAVYRVNAQSGELECSEEPTLDEVIAKHIERRRRDPKYDEQQRAYSTFADGPGAKGYAKAKAFVDKEHADAIAYDIDCTLHNWRLAVKEGARDCILWPSREKIQQLASWPGVKPAEWAAFKQASIDWFNPFCTPEVLKAEEQLDYERAVESLSDPKTVNRHLLRCVHDPENIKKLVAQMSDAKVAWIQKNGLKHRRPAVWAIWETVIGDRIQQANEEYDRKLAACKDTAAIAEEVAQMSPRQALRVLQNGLQYVDGMYPELIKEWIPMLHAKINDPIPHPSSPSGHGFKWAYEQRDQRDLPWILDDLMLAGTWGLLTAATRMGKTFLMIHLALCTYAGRAFFGRQIRRRGGTLIVAAEAAYSIPHRIDAALRNTFEGTVEPAIAYDGPPPNLLHAPSLALYIARLRQLAAEMQARHGVPLQLIIIDTFSKAFPGVNEDKASEVVLAHNALEQIAQALNVAVVVAAHTGKDAGKGTRGSAAHEQNSHFVLRVPAQGVLHLFKQKEAPDDLVMGRFEMPTVELGMNGQGVPITSRVIREIAAGPLAPFGSVEPPEEAIRRDRIFGMAFVEASPDGVVALIDAARVKFMALYPQGKDTNPVQAANTARKAWRKALKKAPAGFAINGDTISAIAV
jgi:hypothetical protein